MTAAPASDASFGEVVHAGDVGGRERDVGRRAGTAARRERGPERVTRASIPTIQRRIAPTTAAVLGRFPARYHRGMRLIPWEEERLQLFAAAELARRRRAPGCGSTSRRRSRSSATPCSRRRARVRPTRTWRRRDGRRSTRPSPRRGAGARSTRSGSRSCWATGPGSSRWSIRSGATASRPIRWAGRGAHRRPVGRGGQRGPGDDRARGHQPVPAPDPGLVALPVRRVNPRLEFDREAARGFHLDLPAGAYAGWEPGETRTVRLVRLAGRARGETVTRLSAEEYRARYGATTGDRVRLGDTDLWIRVGEDRTARGDEPVWGYAKNLRSRMAQSEREPARRSSTSSSPARSSSTRSSASSRPISASRTAGSPGSAAPAAPDQRRHRPHRPAHQVVHGLRPHRTPAPSTPTSTRSAPSSCRPRCPPASRRSSPPGSRSRHSRWSGRSPGSKAGR